MSHNADTTHNEVPIQDVDVSALYTKYYNSDERAKEYDKLNVMDIYNPSNILLPFHYSLLYPEFDAFRTRKAYFLSKHGRLNISNEGGLYDLCERVAIGAIPSDIERVSLYYRNVEGKYLRVKSFEHPESNVIEFYKYPIFLLRDMLSIEVVLSQRMIDECNLYPFRFVTVELTILTLTVRSRDKINKSVRSSLVHEFIPPSSLSWDS